MQQATESHVAAGMLRRSRNNTYLDDFDGDRPGRINLFRLGYRTSDPEKSQTENYQASSHE
jgi:hypothetical protein